MQGIPHHLLSVLNYNETCSVRDYRDRAMTVISFSKIHFLNLITLININQRYKRKKKTPNSCWRNKLLYSVIII